MRIRSSASAAMASWRFDANITMSHFDTALRLSDWPIQIKYDCWFMEGWKVSKAPQIGRSILTP